MTEHEFKRITQYMATYYGIDLSKKRIIVEGRMDNYIANKGYKDYETYMDAVEANLHGKEAQNIVNILTTNHTFFLREAEHYEYLRNVILPEIKKKEEATRNLRIWSAACSTGEEPYTIAMVIKDFFGLEYRNWDTTILATDISVEVLTKAIEGVYQDKQIEALPKRWIDSNFTKMSEHDYKVKDELKQKVLFRQFNLMNPLPFRHQLHAVFLRNVMIYFNDEIKDRLVRRIVDCLVPGGYLIIGMTEHIDRSLYDLEYVETSIYRKEYRKRIDYDA